MDGTTERRGVHQDATRRSIPLLETLRYRFELSLVRASVFASGNAVAPAADRRRQRQLRLQSALLNHYRRLITTGQLTQVRLTGDAL